MENQNEDPMRNKKNAKAANPSCDAESPPMAEIRANLEGIRDKRHYRT
jgi:hypothetical protein